MTYKNPIPCLPGEEKYDTFRICFKFEEPLTKREAAENLTKYFKEKGINERYLYGEKERK